MCGWGYDTINLICTGTEWQSCLALTSTSDLLLFLVRKDSDSAQDETLVAQKAEVRRNRKLARERGVKRRGGKEAEKEREMPDNELKKKNYRKWQARAGGNVRGRRKRLGREC